MNPIITEFRRLFPSVEVTRQIEHAADRADDPQAVAQALEGQASGWRDQFDRALGPGVATEADVAARVSLSSTSDSVGHMSLETLLYPLGYERAFELGQATGLIPTLYREELGREPDAAGEAFWRETWTAQFRAGIK